MEQGNNANGFYVLFYITIHPLKTEKHQRMVASPSVRHNRSSLQGPEPRFIPFLLDFLVSLGEFLDVFFFGLAHN